MKQLPGRIAARHCGYVLATSGSFTAIRTRTFDGN